MAKFKVSPRTKALEKAEKKEGKSEAAEDVEMAEDGEDVKFDDDADKDLIAGTSAVVHAPGV